MSTVLDVVREHLPHATAQVAEHIAWNHTGFPTFFVGDPTTEFRCQVAGFVYLGPVDEHDDDGCWTAIKSGHGMLSLIKARRSAWAGAA